MTEKISIIDLDNMTNYQHTQLESALEGGGFRFKYRNGCLEVFYEFDEKNESNCERSEQ